MKEHLTKNNVVGGSKFFVLIVSALVFSISIVSAKVLATVDGVQITESVFDELKAQNPGFDFNKLPKKDQQDLLNQAIDNILISKEAQKNKLDTTPEFTQTFNKITQSIKDRLLVQIWVQQEARNIASKTQVTEQEALKYYNDHKSDFSQPNVHARHIVVKTESEAKKIIDELNRVPKSKIEEKFIEIANKQTMDPGNKQAQNGGDLGSFTKEQMVKPFSDAAFGMNVGAFSKAPVKTEFGYHVIYVVDKANEYSFDKIKPALMNMLGEQKVGQELKKKVDGFRSKANVKITL